MNIFFEGPNSADYAINGTSAQFDTLVKELRGLTDFERDLNNPGTV